MISRSGDRFARDLLREWNRRRSSVGSSHAVDAGFEEDLEDLHVERRSNFGVAIEIFG